MRYYAVYGDNLTSNSLARVQQDGHGSIYKTIFPTLQTVRYACKRFKRNYKKYPTKIYNEI